MVVVVVVLIVVDEEEEDAEAVVVAATVDLGTGNVPVRIVVTRTSPGGVNAIDVKLPSLKVLTMVAVVVSEEVLAVEAGSGADEEVDLIEVVVAVDLEVVAAVVDSEAALIEAVEEDLGDEVVQTGVVVAEARTGWGEEMTEETSHIEHHVESTFVAAILRSSFCT